MVRAGTAAAADGEQSVDHQGVKKQSLPGSTTNASEALPVLPYRVKTTGLLALVESTPNKVRTLATAKLSGLVAAVIGVVVVFVIVV
jgi:hypothetical protein